MNKELVVDTFPKSIISEAIRMIRTNIQFKSNKLEATTIYITSSVPGEGKSFISSNLAIAFAQLGKKTLLIDCDLRRGRIHKLFNISNNFGLSSVLDSDLIFCRDDYVIKSKIANLDVIVRGAVPGNPSELLNHNGITVLIDELKKKYDYIIFDGVPVVGLADSLIMAKKTEMVLLVSACKVCTRDLLKNAVKSLQGVDANIVGIVANKIENTSSKYYKYD